MEAMRPFMNYDDRTVIVLCRTSNPGAGEFQDVPCTPVRLKNGKRLFSTVEEACREGYSAQDEFEDMPPMPLYQFVATRVAQSWNDINGNCAVVVGATYPEELGIVRDLIGHMPILLPGIGAQGGDMEKSFAQGVKDPRDILAANNASGINFAFQKIKDGDRLKYHPNQYMEAAAEAAEAMNNAARELLAA
jgi:orotidine-5'-phosphate decarboxylase